MKTASTIKNLFAGVSHKLIGLRDKTNDTALRLIESTPAYSTLDMEAALCIWEHFLDSTSGAHKNVNPELTALRDAIGTVEFRHRAIALARYCGQVYDLIPEHARDGVAYDWEVIPAILDTVDWSVGTGEPKPTHTAASLAAVALLAHHQSPQTLADQIASTVSNGTVGDPQESDDDGNTVRKEWNVACPQCHSDENLAVMVKAWANLSVDGSDVFGDQEWDQGSPIRCSSCDWEGIVSDAAVTDSYGKPIKHHSPDAATPDKPS